MLNPRQIKFVRNLLQGLTYTEAYKEAGYKPKNDDVAVASASALVRIPKVKAFWDEEKDNLLALTRSRIVSLAMDAVPIVQKQMLNEKNPGTQLAAAKDILDRAGIKAPTKLEFGTDGNVIINFVGLDETTFPDAEDAE